MKLNVPHKKNRLKALKRLIKPQTLKAQVSGEVGSYESCRLITYTYFSKRMDKRQRRRYLRELDTVYRSFLKGWQC